jgi:hypothetical protein
LLLLFTGEEPEAYDYYYPLPLTNADECRAHSWWLSCLLVINQSWHQVRRFQTMAEVSPEAAPSGSANDAYAHYRIMGSFVPLLYAVIGNNVPHTDDAWRPRPDGRPNLFELFCPEHTTCFHAGDLPALDCLFDQVGLFGVVNVKRKVPLVQLLIKAMPICCQSRDLRENLVGACRDVNGEGYWRIVRSIFWVGLTGLYPGARQRVPFRDMLRIYHLLFHDKEGFLDALDFESKERAAWLAANPNKSKKKEAATKTCQLIEVVMREFFVYSVRNNRNWIEVVDKRIRWDDFADKTQHMADEMRLYGRFADAPQGNDFVHAIDALTRCKSTYNKDVYRFRKKEYVHTVSDTINTTQDELHEQRRREGKEVILIEAMLDRLVDAEILDEDDLAPLLQSRHARIRFGGDPVGLFRRAPDDFSAAVQAAADDSRHIYDHNLGYAVPAEIKRNIIDFLVRTPPGDRFRFDVLLDERLGGVSRETVQTLAKTRHIYETRSSPKSIKTHIQNLKINDLRVVSWYFNIVSSIERFNLIPLDCDTVEQQAWAMRSYRFRLMPDEPLPPGAWIVYVCICCKRIATFSDSPMYGNFGVSYDPCKRNMVCSKKVTRAARVRHQRVDASGVLDDTEMERAKKEKDTRQKKARADRKEDNALPCEGQPVIPVDMYGVALEFDGDRFLMCPGCGQFHTYRDSGWGHGGYRCKSCRDRETPLDKMSRCAYCEGTHDLRKVDVVATFKDPTNPDHSLLADPTSCYQTLWFCQKCANSIGLFEKHPNDRLHEFLPKDKLWSIIGPTTQERTIKNYVKYN